MNGQTSEERRHRNQEDLGALTWTLQGLEGVAEGAKGLGHGRREGGR